MYVNIHVRYINIHVYKLQYYIKYIYLRASGSQNSGKRSKNQFCSVEATDPYSKICKVKSEKEKIKNKSRYTIKMLFLLYLLYSENIQPLTLKSLMRDMTQIMKRGL